MLGTTFLGVLIFVTVFALISILERPARAKVKFLLSGRDALSNDAIFENYYHNRDLNKRVVITVWRELSLAYRIPMGLLRPCDTLEMLGQQRPLPFHDISERVNDILRHYDPDGDADPKSFKTVDDLVVHVAANWHGRHYLSDSADRVGFEECLKKSEDTITV